MSLSIFQVMQAPAGTRGGEGPVREHGAGPGATESFSDVLGTAQSRYGTGAGGRSGVGKGPDIAEASRAAEHAPRQGVSGAGNGEVSGEKAGKGPVKDGQGAVAKGEPKRSVDTHGGVAQGPGAGAAPVEKGDKAGPVRIGGTGYYKEAIDTGKAAAEVGGAEEASDANGADGAGAVVAGLMPYTERYFENDPAEALEWVAQWSADTSGPYTIKDPSGGHSDKTGGGADTSAIPTLIDAVDAAEGSGEHGTMTPGAPAVADTSVDPYATALEALTGKAPEPNEALGQGKTAGVVMPPAKDDEAAGADGALRQGRPVAGAEPDGKASLVDPATEELSGNTVLRDGSGVPEPIRSGQVAYQAVRADGGEKAGKPVEGTVPAATVAEADGVDTEAGLQANTRTAGVPAPGRTTDAGAEKPGATVPGQPGGARPYQDGPAGTNPVETTPVAVSAGKRPAATDEFSIKTPKSNDAGALRVDGVMPEANRGARPSDASATTVGGPAGTDADVPAPSDAPAAKFSTDIAGTPRAHQAPQSTLTVDSHTGPVSPRQVEEAAVATAPAPAAQGTEASEAVAGLRAQAAERAGHGRATNGEETARAQADAAEGADTVDEPSPTGLGTGNGQSGEENNRGFGPDGRWAVSRPEPTAAAGAEARAGLVNNTFRVEGLDTATAPAEGRARVAPGSGAFEGLGEGVRMSFARGGQEVSVRLKPEHLGALFIKLSGTNKDVSARVVVESAAVKGIFEADAGRLREVFAEQGLTLNKYSIEVGTGSSNPFDDGRFAGGGADWPGTDARQGGRAGSNGARSGANGHLPGMTPLGAGPDSVPGPRGVDIFA